jgi:hypothetical protein
MTLTGIDDLDNIIYDYKTQMELKDKMQKLCKDLETNVYHIPHCEDKTQIRIFKNGKRAKLVETWNLDRRFLPAWAS